MPRRSACLAALALSNQPDSQSNPLTSSDEVDGGGGPCGVTDDDDPDHPWCFLSDGKCMIMCDH